MTGFRVLSIVAAMVCITTSAYSLDRQEMDGLRDKAVRIIEEKGTKAGAEFLKDKANGFIDLQGPGLHTWAISRAGVIAFDHSGQTEPGMDISSLTTNNGQTVVAKTFAVADKPGGAGYAEDTWPHPVSGVLSNSYVTCGTPKTDKNLAICVMAWVK